MLKAIVSSKDVRISLVATKKRQKRMNFFTRFCDKIFSLKEPKSATTNREPMFKNNIHDPQRNLLLLSKSKYDIR